MVRSIRKSSIIIVFWIFTLSAGNDEELFLRANKLYEVRNYDQALALYLMIPHKGRAVLYNMGNCYFYKNDYANALICWERAKKGATWQEYKTIDFNSNLLLQRLNKKQDLTWFSKMLKIIDIINCSMPRIAIQFLFLLLWIFLLWLYHRNRLKKIYVCLLNVSLLVLGNILFMQYMGESVRKGFVTKDISLFACPQQEAEVIGSLKCTDCVFVKESRKEWYKVRYSDNIGWVEADAIQIV